MIKQWSMYPFLRTFNVLGRCKLFTAGCTGLRLSEKKTNVECLCRSLLALLTYGEIFQLEICTMWLTDLAYCYILLWVLKPAGKHSTWIPPSHTGLKFLVGGINVWVLWISFVVLTSLMILCHSILGSIPSNNNNVFQCQWSPAKETHQYIVVLI